MDGSCVGSGKCHCRVRSGAGIVGIRSMMRGWQTMFRISILPCLSILLLAACGHSSGPPVAVASVDAARSGSRAVIAAAAPVASAVPGAGTGRLQSGVYVWQRAWIPANASALADSRGMFSEVRVLAAQEHSREGWIDARVDLAALAADGRAIRPVIRLDGRLPALDADAVAKRAHDLVAAWRAAGVHADGVEIDFDCPSSRLADYAKLLAAIKPRLPSDATLSITALPTWIGAPGLADVLAQSDEAVLQVHAVSDPRHGLFDAQQAAQWIAAFAKQSAKPFRVALPAYGSALVVDANGKTVGVESEAALDEAGERLELFSDPRDVQGLLKRLEAEPPPNLRGIVWFRLPLPGDRRAWPLATIAAVIEGNPLQSAWTPEIADGGNGAFDISVRNSGNIEAVLPASIDVGGSGCTDADALPGYRIDRGRNVLRFVRETGASLPATQTRPLGWVRCTQLLPGDLHVHA